MKHMNINSLTPAVGAELSGIDLSVEPTESEQLALRKAFLKHHVLFFRDQRLQPDDLVRFAGLFGQVGRYPFAEPMADHPEVIAIIKEPVQTTVFGGIWHTDSAYLETPSLASVLYSREVPAEGGDTLFANASIAYDTLDDELKTAIANRSALHSSARNRSLLREDHLSTGSMSAQQNDIMEAVHPVVRTHPDTRKQSLYLSPAHTVKILGLPSEQSELLLNRLTEHLLKDDFKCRFRWTPNTLAIWDNRCLLHYPVNDYQGHRREMWRVTIDGDRPV